MGYTHYWDMNPDAPREAWGRTLMDARTIIDFLVNHDVPLAYERDQPDAPPMLEEGLIRFNGVEEEGCETFVLSPHGDGWNFCKTRRKPYDMAVGCVLLRAAYHGLLTVQSDGDWVDWTLVVQLYMDLFDPSTLPPVNGRQITAADLA